MTLAEVRARVVELNGRRDMESGAAQTTLTFFVNQAIKKLDRMVKTPRELARQQYDISTSILTYRMYMTKCRSVQEVWITDAVDGTKTQLERKTLTWLRNNYPKPVSSLNAGRPKYYAPMILALAPDQSDLDDTSYLNEFSRDADGLLLQPSGVTAFEYTGITWRPPADAEYTVTVIGQFYSPELSSDSDKNFWTEVHPDLVILATLYVIEVAYRNSEGANDWYNALKPEIKGLEDDAVEGEVVDINQMGG
jgi:hypothetical protein